MIWGRTHPDVDGGSCGQLCTKARSYPGGSKGCLEHAADDMKWYYDQSHQSMPEYKVGDKVWLSLQNYSSDHPMKKLDDKWAGPFTSPRLSPLPPSNSVSLHERNTSTPTSPTRLQNVPCLHSPAWSLSKTKRSTRSRKSWTPGSGDNM